MKGANCRRSEGENGTSFSQADKASTCDSAEEEEKMCAEWMGSGGIEYNSMYRKAAKLRSDGGSDVSRAPLVP